MGNPRRIQVRALRELAEAWEQAIRRYVTSDGDAVAAVRILEPLKSSIGSPTLIALTAALSRAEGWEQDADGVFRYELTGGYIAFDPASCELEIVAQLAADVQAEGEAGTTVSGPVEDDVEAEAVGRYYDDGWGGRTESTGRQDAATNADRELAQARAEWLARARAKEEAEAAGTAQARAEEAAQAALSDAMAARRAELERQAVHQLTAVGEQGRATFQQVVALAYRDAMLAYARSRHAQGVRVSDSGGVLDIEFRTVDPRYREPGGDVRINFRYRPDTGEVERFEVDDLHAGPPFSDDDARLDRAATEVARIVESNARIEEVAHPEIRSCLLRGVSLPLPTSPRVPRLRGPGTRRLRIGESRLRNAPLTSGLRMANSSAPAGQWHRVLSPPRDPRMPTMRRIWICRPSASPRSRSSCTPFSARCPSARPG